MNFKRIFFNLILLSTCANLSCISFTEWFKDIYVLYGNIIYTSDCNGSDSNFANFRNDTMNVMCTYISIQLILTFVCEDTFSCMTITRNNTYTCLCMSDILRCKWLPTCQRLSCEILMNCEGIFVTYIISNFVFMRCTSLVNWSNYWISVQ